MGLRLIEEPVEVSKKSGLRLLDEPIPVFTEEKEGGLGITDALSAVVDPFIQTGRHAAASLNKGVANFGDNLDKVASLMPGENKGFFKSGADSARENAAYWDEQIATHGGDSITGEIVGGATGGAIPGITEFMMNVPWAAATGYADGGVEGATLGTIKRLIMGGILKSTHGLTPAASVPVNAAIFGGQTLAEGGSVVEAAKAAGEGAVYSFAHKGNRTAGDAARNFASAAKGDITSLKKATEIDMSGLPGRGLLPAIEPAGVRPEDVFKRKIVQVPADVPAPTPTPTGRGFRPLDVPKPVVEGDGVRLEDVIDKDSKVPVTPQHVADQLALTGKSLDGRQRAAVLKEIGTRLAEGKTIGEAHADLVRIADERGMPPEFKTLVRGVIVSLEDMVKPPSTRVDVGGGHGRPEAFEAMKVPGYDQKSPFEQATGKKATDVVSELIAESDGRRSVFEFAEDIYKAIDSSPNYNGKNAVDVLKDMALRPMDYGYGFNELQLKAILNYNETMAGRGGISAHTALRGEEALNVSRWAHLVGTDGKEAKSTPQPRSLVLPKVPEKMRKFLEASGSPIPNIPWNVEGILYRMKELGYETSKIEDVWAWMEKNGF
jgi:hypothetical protein